MMLVCSDFKPNCYLGNCRDCPGSGALHKRLLDIFSENDVTFVTYKQWVSKPRTTLETVLDQPIEQFVQTLQKLAEILLKHAFIAKQQAAFYKKLKMDIAEGECVVQVDFAENYAFVVQEAAPGFHWNNNQATIYTVVIYFNNGNGMEHKSLVIISDCMSHDAVAVFMYSRIINDLVRDIVVEPRKIFYFSDGAPQQYKNFKNFANIYHHEDDFGIPAEWNFFATAHGKGPCDGLGGTVKRLAARASLQRSSQDQITTPYELYRWAVDSGTISSIVIRYVDHHVYNKEKELLNARFAAARPIKNTQSLHCVIPDKSGIIKSKLYSMDDSSDVHNIFKGLN